MKIIFRVSSLEGSNDSDGPWIQLVPGSWDDYSFKTAFTVIFHGKAGESISLGSLKIGYINQAIGWTKEALPSEFNTLPDGFFSLGQDVEYYDQLFKYLNREIMNGILIALGDIVYDDKLFSRVKNEAVFRESLIRNVSLSTITGQFKRVITGQPKQTEFKFSYHKAENDKQSEIDLSFSVRPEVNPSSNIHILIGRNGVGKTTILNNMVSSICTGKIKEFGGFYVGSENSSLKKKKQLPPDYFSSVVSVSFSAFDPFLPPADRPDRSRGSAYFYIGMKRARSEGGNLERQPPKTDQELANDLIESLSVCISEPEKRKRWFTAIKRLESDSNFEEMSLGTLLDKTDEDAISSARSLVSRMSSGHFIVLLTLTKLVETVEEKTLVLLDEPESHLHPPLLSAFTRALSELLTNRNAVAIIATHSPVMLQEVPRTCVWKLMRLRNQGRSDRPERETFGENVGVLTREVFGLEVSKSGFHDMLQQAVNEGGSFDKILDNYNDQLGFEAQAVLRVLLAQREESSVSPK